MTDSTLNRFLAYGTNAARLAFTPSVPTPASGPSQAYIWYETDTGDTYAYASAAWHKISSVSPGNVSGPGSSTDRAVATWNSTTGTLLRDNSAVTIDVSGNITTSGKATVTGNISGGNLTTAGNVTGANIGNITPTNLDGNGTHVFLGNGTWGKLDRVLITETITVASASNVTFSSISASYRNLEVEICSARGDDAGGEVVVYCQVNSDTGSNYDFNQGFARGSPTGVQGSAQVQMKLLQIPAAGSTASFAGAGRITFYAYSDTTFYKQCSGCGGENPSASGMTAMYYAGQWRNTAAINAIKIYLSVGNFVNGSIVRLYGIY